MSPNFANATHASDYQNLPDGIHSRPEENTFGNAEFL